ncbi:MAG: hypothetical protein HY084_12780 [Gemmatimonadetes bacterium]|nr:hypothetical protein [Gemmatimonadota bacterium]
MAFRIAIILHLLSMALLAAGGIGGALLLPTLAAAARGEGARLPGLVAAAAHLGVIARVGSVLMLPTGAVLLWTMNWVELTMPWMTLKLAFYLATWVVSFTMATPAELRLASALSRRANGADVGAELEATIARLRLAHALMLVCFVAMVAIVVVRTR